MNGNEVSIASGLAGVGLPNTQGTYQGWYYDAATAALYVHSSANPAGQYTSMEGNLGPTLLNLSNGVKHIVIDGLDFRGGGAFVDIHLDSVSYIAVRNSNIGLGSYNGLFIGSSSPNAALTSSHILVESNTFDSAYRFRYTINPFGSEDAINLRDAVNNVTIRNNICRDWGHTAIHIWGSSTTKDGCYNNKIHNNILEGPNLSYARGLGVDGVEGKAHDNEIYNNLVRNFPKHSQLNGNNNWIHHK